MRRRKPVLATDEQAFGVLFLKLRGILAPFKADKIEIRQTIGAYFSVLKPWPLHAVSLGADRCASRMNRFPKPVDWIEAIPKAKAAGMLRVTDEERAEYRAALDAGFNADPCGCHLCQQAGVSHRFLRYVPDEDADGHDLNRVDGDRIITLGHWAHGDELVRWYAARDHFLSLKAHYLPRSMPKARRRPPLSPLTQAMVVLGQEMQASIARCDALDLAAPHPDDDIDDSMAANPED
jgi:hypothetical protein